MTGKNFDFPMYDEALACNQSKQENSAIDPEKIASALIKTGANDYYQTYQGKKLSSAHFKKNRQSWDLYFLKGQMALFRNDELMASFTNNQQLFDFFLITELDLELADISKKIENMAGEKTPATPDSLTPPTALC